MSTKNEGREGPRERAQTRLRFGLSSLPNAPVWIGAYSHTIGATMSSDPRRRAKDRRANSRPRQSPSNNDGLKLLLAAILLAVLVGLLYLPALHFGFIYDDHAQIQTNPEIQSWRNLGRLYQEPLWAQLGPERASPYYRPLFSALLLIEHTLFHLDPQPWHAASIGLHLLVAGALFLFLWLNLRQMLPALFGAALFACSPLATEVVCWVSASDESLGALLVLLSLCLATLWKQSRDRRRALCLQFLTAATLCLAVCAKETAIVGVALVLVYQLLFARPPKRQGRWLDGCVLLSPLLLFVLTHRTLHAPSPVHPAELITTMCTGALLALRTLIWPSPISGFYDLWFGQAHPLLAATGAVAVVALIAGGLFWSWRRSPLATLGLLLSVLPIVAWDASLYYLRNYDLFHARYLYLSATGLSVMAAALLSAAAPAMNRDRGAKGLSFAAIVILIVGDAWQVRADFWQFRDDLSLFSHAVQTAPQNIVAWQLLADTELQDGNCPGAVEADQQAERLRPDIWKTSFFLGTTYLRCGMAAQAATAFSQSTTLPDITQEQAALAWFELGRAFLVLGDTSDALRALQKAAARDPGSRRVRSLLARVLGATPGAMHDREELQGP